MLDKLTVEASRDRERRGRSRSCSRNRSRRRSQPRAAHRNEDARAQKARNAVPAAALAGMSRPQPREPPKAYVLPDGNCVGELSKKFATSGIDGLQTSTAITVKRAGGPDHEPIYLSSIALKKGVWGSVFGVRIPGKQEEVMTITPGGEYKNKKQA